MNKLTKYRAKNISKTKGGFSLLGIVVFMALFSIGVAITTPIIIEDYNKKQDLIHKANLVSIYTAADLAHKDEEELDVDKIISYSNISNIKVQDSPEAGYYTVDKDIETGLITVNFSYSGALKKTYSGGDAEEFNEDIFNVVQNDKPTPEPDVDEEVVEDIDYTRYLKVSGRRIRGLTSEGRNSWA